MIYVVGDSHSHAYYDSKITMLPSDAGTMHRIGRDGLQDRLRSISLNSADILLVVIGEVDIRCHIYRQIHDNNRDEEEILDTLASKFILRLVELKTTTNCNIIVRGVVPPLPNGDHPDIHSQKPEDLTYIYPIRGLIDDRSRWRISLNQKLASLCASNGLYFLPSPIWVETDDHMLRDEFSDHRIHIAGCFDRMKNDLFRYRREHQMIFPI